MKQIRRGGITINGDIKKSITKYKALVFDLDGTLYYQKRLRIKMAWMLLSYYLCHFWRIKELFIVKKFREVREDWERISCSLCKDGEASESEGSASGLEDEQYLYVAGKMKCSAMTVKNTVEAWMYERPLKTVYETRDIQLLELIERFRAGGQNIFIFSDYPIEDKLKALGIEADGMYAATDERVNELKPSPKGLELIMEDHGFASEDLLMIGDRMSRDGQAAVNAGCDYIILPGSRRGRALLYKELSEDMG